MEKYLCEYTCFSRKGWSRQLESRDTKEVDKIMRKINKISLIIPPENFFSSQTFKDKISSLIGYFRTGGIHAGSAWPPLGILYLGAVLKEAGYAVSALDAAVKGWYFDKIERWVKKEDPDVVGISTLTANFLHGIEIARRIKEASPEVKTVVGGYHATFMADQTLKKFPFIDLVVRGEAEETIVDTLLALEGKKKFSEVDGISYRSNKRVVHNRPAKFITNLDELQKPDRSLIEDEYVNTIGPVSLAAGKFTTIITSRGCPQRCTFCSCTAFRKNISKFRSPDGVVEELEELTAQGYEDIGIVDDSFTIVKKRVEKICELIKEKHLEFNWWCDSRVDFVDHEMFLKMKKAGCSAVFFGLESGNQRILDYYQKGITPQQSIRAVDAAKKAGLNVTGTFIVGATVETKSEVINTLEFAKRLDMDAVGIGPLWVYPGAQIWDELVAKNQELQERYWASGFVPVELGMCEYSKEWLENAIGKTLREFYLNPLFISRQVIKSFRDPYRRKVVTNIIDSHL
jgi:anaerobic magnesium-protoporphyrin IX monomethyl ester cyclase